MSALREIAASDDGSLARAIVTSGPVVLRATEAELCRRFAPRVRHYGLRHLRSEDSAAELVQRVLTLTIEKLRAGAVREPNRIASFVLGSARMIAHEMRRAAPGEAPNVEVGDGPSDGFDGVDVLRRDRLQHCLGQLPERERSVLVLTYFQDLSAREVGLELSLSEGNVRVVRYRAIEHLKKCMDVEEMSA